MSAAAARVPADDAADECPREGPEALAEQRLLATFGRRARAANLARVLRLAQLLDTAEAGALDEAGRLEAQHLAHQVVGSAGTFGHASASRAAVAVERHFSGPCGGGTAEVRAVIDRLRVEFGGQP